MKTYLIDTTVVIDYLRGQEAAGDLLNKIGEPIISIIVQGEVIQGIKNKSELRKASGVFEKFEILDLSASIDNLAINLLKQFTLSHGLKLMDALIAATAIEHKLIFVTSNTKHFKFIKNLEVLKPEQVV